MLGCFGADLRWHISIRDRRKGGHLERVEMTGNRQEILCLLQAVQLDYKKDGRDGDIKGFM
jgi:hypothetical protein